MRSIISPPVAALAVLLSLPAGAGAEVWQVTEGPDGRITGLWDVTITNGAISGEAKMMTADHKPLTYSLSGKVDGNDYVIDRFKPSDANECTYKGSAPQMPGLKKATEISGTAMCQSRTGIWKVRLPASK